MLHLEFYNNVKCTKEEERFLTNFIDSFLDANYENCAYLFKEFLLESDSYISIDVHYDFERELFYNER